MRISNKSSIFTGVVLLLLAALFSISLLSLPLAFASTENTNTFFFSLGDMLFSSYGFSSIFIPVFLLIAGLSCFASTWTARRTMTFLTAFIPFFTIVITENICRTILSQYDSDFMALKLVICIVTGAMLVTIEFLGIGLIADRVNDFFFHKTVNSNSVTSLRKIKVPKVLRKSEDSLEDQTEDVISLINEIKEYKTNKLSPAETETVSSLEDKAEEAQNEASSEPQSSLITEEEYAALTINDAEDELEWNNLPPVPETLPPEYDEEYEEAIDENDPALQFPPVDEPIDNVAEEFIENSEDETQIEQIDNPFEVFEISPKVDVEEESEIIEDEEIIDNNFEDFAEFSDDISLVEEPQEEADNNFLDKYNAKQFPKSEFSSGIKFQKEDFPEEEKKNLTTHKSEYPSGIRLNDDDSFLDSEIQNYENFSEEEVFEEETLPNFYEETTSKPTYQKKISIRDELAMHGNNTPGITLKPLASSVAAAAIPVSSSVTKVFSDMENDIRSTQISSQNDVINEDANFSEVDADQFDNLNDYFDQTDSLEPTEENTPVVLSKTSAATNLTADELSDFFTAQEIENTPKTQEIQGNAPKIGNKATKKGPYVIPSDLLTAYKDDQYWIIDEQTKNASLSLKQTLSEFNIEAEIIGIKKGPVVTMFEILPAPGVKLSKIVALQDNIALALAAQSVRIVAPIPGKQAVGIEVPNKNRSVVGFREIIEMDLPEWKKMAVPVILGKDILGKAQLIDLVKTPHMLIAGATGSGKSVCVNSLILSILYKRSYQDVKMILVDPKVVELKLYNNIPHLLTPVITEPKKALQALQYCLCEMERRYALLDGMGVRDISNYNAKIKEQKICTEKLPYIVVIIDEFADLMATSGKELESIVARLTAMSRAVGIHLVLATQRPSVNVITGLIKANIPTRIAFMVASRTDSNIIIDTVGAEKLLGRGDMLYASAVDPAPIRIQGTFVSDQEVENVVTAVKEYGEPDYIDEEIFVDDDDDVGARDLFGDPVDDDDPLYDQALQVVVQAGKASASYIQRRLKIGYNRAARLVEEMEERGIVGPANGSKPREIIHYP